MHSKGIISNSAMRFAPTFVCSNFYRYSNREKGYFLTKWMA